MQYNNKTTKPKKQKTGGQGIAKNFNKLYWIIKRPTANNQEVVILKIP